MHHSRADRLEVLSSTPLQPRPGLPPLLFLHGAYTAAWCWEHYLPHFAAAGFACHALSFSGHGTSRRRDHLDSYSIDDYVNDIAETVATLPAPPCSPSRSRSTTSPATTACPSPNRTALSGT